jgi:hypothetical protein
MVSQAGRLMYIVASRLPLLLLSLLLLLLLPAVEQIAFADRILLNKTDLVGAEELAAIKDRIKVGTTLLSH